MAFAMFLNFPKQCRTVLAPIFIYFVLQLLFLFSLLIRTVTVIYLTHYGL